LDAEVQAKFPTKDLPNCDGVMVADVGALVSWIVTLHDLKSEDVIQINFGADGRNHSRGISSIMAGFTIGNEGSHSQRDNNFYTLAIWVGDEKRPDLDGPMGALVEAMLILEASGFADDDGKHHAVELTFSSDMKMLSASGGVTCASAHGHNSKSCPWCRATYHDRTEGGIRVCRAPPRHTHALLPRIHPPIIW
jgi:hypothetical protein